MSYTAVYHVSDLHFARTIAKDAFVISVHSTQFSIYIMNRGI